MLITLQKVGKSFGAERILEGVTATVDRQDRIGIIGENGTGKTTLVRIITGSLVPDEGEVTYSHNLTWGYLEQNASLDTTRTVWEEMEDAYAPSLEAMRQLEQLNRELALHPDDPKLLEQHAAATAIIDAQDAYHREVQIRKVLSGMAFPPQADDKLVRVLSGGERTRLQLAKLLLQNPDVLILDEPTNHLDFRDPRVARELSQDLFRRDSDRLPRPVFPRRGGQPDLGAGAEHHHLLPGQLLRLSAPEGAGGRGAAEAARRRRGPRQEAAGVCGQESGPGQHHQDGPEPAQAAGEDGDHRAAPPRGIRAEVPV